MQYFSSFRHSLAGRRIVRILPFRAISALPHRRASTVIYFTSETRMPVEQIVSISKSSRSRPAALAAAISRSNSPRVSSRRFSRKSWRWTRSAFTWQSPHPRKARNRLADTSMLFTVPGQRPPSSSDSFHAAIRSLVTGASPIHAPSAATCRR